MSKITEVRKTNMIKTLRITSIIAAVLAAGILVFPAIFGLRSDKRIEEFLSLPSIVEKFRKARGDRHKSSDGEVSPLVKYAQAFGLYLNPPPAPKKVVKRPRDPGRPHAPEIVKRPRVTAKFKLIATSFSASRPELSVALIDTPGKGRQWVRESSIVNYLTIEQIKDGLIVVKGAKGTFEIAAEARPPRRSLLADSSPVSMGEGSTIPSEPVAALSSDEDGSITATDAGVAGGGSKQMSPEEEAALVAKLFAELKALAAEGSDESAKTDSGQGAEDPEALEKPFSGVKATRVTGKEVKKLDRLGKELKGTGEDVGQDPNRPRSRKVEKASKKSWKSRRPPPKKSKARPSSKRRTSPKRRPSSRRRPSSKRRTPSKEQTEK
jgi:hypothetical protein